MYTKNCNPKTMNRFTNGMFSAPIKLENFFSDLFAGTGIETSYGTIPAVNIKENEKEFTLELTAPGFEKEEVKLKLEENTLTISGEKKAQTEETKENYTRLEFKAEKFSRRFKLPENINADEIKAEFKNGILYVTIPKIDAQKKEGKEIVIL